MSVENPVLDVLQNSPCAYLVNSSSHLHEVQTNVYRLASGGRSYFLKRIPKDDWYGANELLVNETVLPQGDILAPRLLCVARTGAAAVACWEWLDGVDLRSQHRELLTTAFADLGRFHLARRHRGPVFSPTTRQPHNSIQEMLRAELDILGSFLPSTVQAQCAALWSLLEEGYATFTHGDMHPGNLRLTQRGVHFVDWGYALPSLNLFDLSYVQEMVLSSDEELPWWIITPREAETLLPAYFRACGLTGLAIEPTMRAIMLWNELVTYDNSAKNHNQSGMASCRRNIDRLLRNQP